mgnify:CR=1 FL=1
MLAIPKTAFVVFGRDPLADARKRGWGEAGRTLFQTPTLPESLLDRVPVYHFGIDRRAANAAKENLRGDSDKIHYRLQRGRDFGERLSNCLDDLAHAGHQSVILVGTDCPDLNDQDILKSYQALDAGGNALGPDDKGGVYLIALQLSDRNCLNNVNWCQNIDFAQLNRRLAHRTLSVLETRIDLDDTADLQRLVSTMQPARLIDQISRLLSRIAQRPVTAVTTDTAHFDARLWIRRMLKYRDAPPITLA